MLFSKGYGFANLEWRVPNDSATKFRLASITKQFTAAAILLLEERGKLTLDDTVKRLLPDAPAAWDRITLRHLLTHTSGIPELLDTPEFADLRSLATTPGELVARFRGQPLDFEPGSQFRYSNSGYILLSYLIEKITGETYENFIRENLFTPLGMNDSGYDSSSAVIPHRAAGYVYEASGYENAAFVDMSISQGAGGLYSTTGDLLKWTQALFGGRLLKPESLAKMTTPFLDNYALGLVIETVGSRKVVRHDGGIAGFDTDLAYYPEDQLTIAVLSNVEADGPDAEALGDDLARLVHGGKRSPGAIFSGTLERVRKGSVTIRLANGLLVDTALPQSADLTAAAIAARYHLADQVQIECALTKGTYDPEAALHLHLVLKNIRLVRGATNREQAQESDRLSWRTGDNLLHVPAPTGSIGVSPAEAAMADFERVRKVNLDHLSKRLNFVADEIARRYRSDGPGQPWKLLDTIETEISVKDGEISRQNVRRNGAPLKHPPDLGTMFFGSELGMLDTGCSTTFSFAGGETVGGMKLLAYGFRAPADGCFATVAARRQRYEEYNPPRTGRILVDPARADILRYESEGGGFPEKFPVDRVFDTESWEYRTIGGSSYPVPVSAAFSTLDADGTAESMRVEYRNHRHFEASTKVTYGPGK